MWPAAVLLAHDAVGERLDPLLLAGRGITNLGSICVVSVRSEPASRL